MDLAEFSHQLLDRLCPGVYRGGTTEGVEPFTLLLRSGNPIMGRYALAVLPWGAIRDPEEPTELLRFARRAMRKHFFTAPLFAQVGLYLIVVGPEARWARIARDVAADMLAPLSPVIIQAVHFVDLLAPADEYHPMLGRGFNFGGTKGVSRVVERILDS